ncbi:DMT family transporter [Amylibacter sp.]|jgi:drug/metabolite transporter (DMT)-like permease|nr:DMT family transporter [Amylibacter sp.]|tara:strand:- start:2109 stop:2945 length:837 start_codon:yes stop_codon:yes gene_type:complete
MTLSVFIAVLFAAILHASWNAIIKFGDDKLQGMVLLSIAHGIIGLFMLILSPLPNITAWPWLIASVGFHLWYKLFLTSAYERGDLSRVYPIARGAAPLLVLVLSSIFIIDSITNKDIFAVIAIGVGIFILGIGVFKNKETIALLPFALCSAIGTAGYSITDGLGARASGDVTSYIGWLFFLDAVVFMLYAFFRKGLNILPKKSSVWVLGLIAGSASVLAYWIAVWAMTIAPIALVAALRETSVLFAVFIGVFFFKDSMGKSKIIASLIIVIGIIISRL